MRVLVIGFPLPNPQIDNFNILTSPSWFDYDGVLVEPRSVSQVIEDVVAAKQQYETRGEEQVLNRPTNPLTVGLADVLKRRRDEVVHLLENGGTIVVFARPNVRHEDVVGFPGCDRYTWLPAPSGTSYEPPFMLRAEGSDVRPADDAHPFAPFLRQYKGSIQYRARFDENVPGFPEWGRVIARSAGGAAVGVELKVRAGTVVMLPAMGGVAFGDQRFALAEAVLDAMRRVNGVRSGPPPTWLRSYSLPGIELLESAESEAQDQIAAAQQRLTSVREELTTTGRLRGLLWQEGPDELEPLVREAFRTIGFDVEASPDRPGWLGDGPVRALFEVEGSSGTVNEAPYVRLQRRLETDLLETKQPKRGVIVINGQRGLDPEQRTAETSETLRVAAASRGYALLTTMRLFEMARAVLEEPLDAVLRSVLRSRLLNTAGEVGPDILPQPPAPEPEPQPAPASPPESAVEELSESAAGDAGEPSPPNA